MPGSHDIDDVLQDTNVVLWEKMEQFELGSNFQTWAFAVARNMAKAHWKKNKRDWSPALNQSIIEAISQNVRCRTYSSRFSLYLVDSE